MKVTLSAIASIMVFATISFSNSLEIHRPSKHSFQFQVNDNFSLRTFGNSWLCYKLHFTRTKAIRFGLSFNANYDENTMNGSNSAVDKTNGAGVSFKSQYIAYLYCDKIIKPYYGLGPYVSTNYSNEREIINGTVINITRRKSIDGGLNGLLGLEWLFHNNFSLFTEYNLQVGYSYYSANNLSNNPTKREHISLSSSNYMVGLSIYL